MYYKVLLILISTFYLFIIYLSFKKIKSIHLKIYFILLYLFIYLFICKGEHFPRRIFKIYFKNVFFANTLREKICLMHILEWE